MKKLLMALAMASVGLPTGLAAVSAPGAVLALSGSSPPAPAADVPQAMLVLYMEGAAECPGLPWQILAGIGHVESDDGRSTLPGVAWGANPAGAEGPMQMEPATFASYARPVPAGGAEPPSPYDPVDAVHVAARVLCASGGGSAVNLGSAIFSYNHSSAYVAAVLAAARALGWPEAAPSPEPGAGRQAVAYALGQVGVAYRWGGEERGVGFDCSGLAQAAWAAAGVDLPRVAQDQFDAGPPLAPGAALAPGDLVFFGARPGAVDHVGIVVDPGGLMVDAPHTGATVRVEAFVPVLGAPWGSLVYLGATAPVASP